MKPFTYRTLIALLATAFVGCGPTPPPTPTAPPPPTVYSPADVGQVPVGQSVATLSTAIPAPATRAWLLHLPGIGGKRSIDLAMTRGFNQGGFNGDTDIYDWTENDSGLHALIAYDRNHKEAQHIAKMITEHYDKDPTAAIYLSGHSGGAGVAVWALEYLPARVKITDLIMLAPALSPTYDLTAALTHVSGKLYVLSSLDDQLVLGTGCRLLGTIDGVKTDAAGRVGFVRPPTGDAGQYVKLVSVPYQSQWVYFHNYGDHIGTMSRSFARAVLAPLVLSGTLPMFVLPPGTQPAFTQAPTTQSASK